jgi:hypothetical protein
LSIDKDLAERIRQKGCSCGGRLHCANYRRAPQGGPDHLPEEYRSRFSFCCDRDGCRKRMTPASRSHNSPRALPTTTDVSYGERSNHAHGKWDLPLIAGCAEFPCLYWPYVGLNVTCGDTQDDSPDGSILVAQVVLLPTVIPGKPCDASLSTGPEPVSPTYPGPTADLQQVLRSGGGQSGAGRDSCGDAPSTPPRPMTSATVLGGWVRHRHPDGLVSRSKSRGQEP